MIDRVAIRGADVPLDVVVADCGIRHGRASSDEGYLASSATIRLIGITQAFAATFTVADVLELDALAAPRFRGNITDAELAGDVLSMTATGFLATAARALVGRTDWPMEPWSSRVRRAFSEAGYIALLDVGDPLTDPLVSARPAELASLASILASLVQTVAAAIVDTPDGRISVQPFNARGAPGAVPFVVPPELVGYVPDWRQIDDVENETTVSYAGGELTATDPSSSGRYGIRPGGVSTELELADDARARALERLNRLSYPDWVIETATLLELVPEVAVGGLVELSPLQAEAPDSRYVGVVEGWAETQQGDDWTMVLTLSAPRLSGYGLRWEGAVGSWEDSAPSSWRDPSSVDPRGAIYA